MNDEPNIIDLFPTPLYVATDVLTEGRESRVNRSYYCNTR